MNNDRFNPYGIFKGIWIPSCIVRNPNLTASAKLVYGQLCFHSGKDGKCYPSQQTLANELGLSDRQIRAVITELENQGFIESESPTGEDRLKHLNNNYYFLWHPSFDETESTSEGTKVPVQSLKSLTTGPELQFRSGPDVDFRSYIREEYNSNNKTEESKEPLALLDSSVLPESQTDSVLATGSLEIPTPLIRRKVATPIEFEKVPRQRYNGVALDVINYWNSSPGLSRHRTPQSINGQLSEPTKTFLSVYNTVGRIMKGNYFNSVGLSKYERVYTKEELINSIDRFKLMATNPSYLPRDKSYFQKISLSSFFYNPYANGEPSLFIKCLESEPVLVADTVKREEEKNPQLKIWLQEMYIEKVLLGEVRKFSVLEENKFIVGSNKLHGTMRRLNARLNMTTRPRDWCEKVIDALIDKWGRSEVQIGHLASDYTYTDTLVRYLKTKGRLD